MPAKKKDLLLGAGSGGGKGLLRTGPAKKGAAWSVVVGLAKTLGITLTAAEAKKVAAGQNVGAKQKGRDVTVGLMDPKAPKAGLTIETDLFCDDCGTDFHTDLDLVTTRLVFLGFHDADSAMAQAIIDGKDLEITDKDGRNFLVGRYDSSLHIRATNLGDGPDLYSDPKEPVNPGTPPSGDEPAAPELTQSVSLATLEADKDFSLGEKVMDAEDGSGSWFATRNIAKGDALGYWAKDGTLASATSINFRDGMADDVKKGIEATRKKRPTNPPKAPAAPPPPPKEDAPAAADELDGEVLGHLAALRRARDIEKRIRGLDADLEKARTKVKEIKDAIDAAENDLHQTVREADPGPLFDRRPKCARCGDRSSALNAGREGTGYVGKHVCPDCSQVLREELEAAERAKRAVKNDATFAPPDDTPSPKSDDQAGSQAQSCGFCQAGDMPVEKPGAESGALYHETADGWVPCLPTEQPPLDANDADAETVDPVDLDALEFTRTTVREKFLELVAKHGDAAVSRALWANHDSRLPTVPKVTVGKVKELAKALDG